MAHVEKRSYNGEKDIKKLSTGAPNGNEKHDSSSWKFWNRLPPWRTPHICSSHHNHKTKEEMEGCNKVREFQLEQEKRLHQEKQKLAEMDKLIKFTEIRQEHLVRKNDILHELR